MGISFAGYTVLLWRVWFIIGSKVCGCFAFLWFVGAGFVSVCGFGTVGLWFVGV